MKNKFGIVIRTSQRPDRENYLSQTIENLNRSKVFLSEQLSFFFIFDTNCDGKHNPNENALRCLKKASEHDVDWIIFLEDDIDVIDNFLPSVDTWLRDCYDDKYILYPLCAEYKDVLEKKIAWKYPISAFYGTQGYCVKKNNLIDLIDFLEKNNKGRISGHDILIKEWASSKNLNFFLTPCPSFIQHIGNKSTLHLGRFHTYSSWPGRDYNYTPRSSIFNTKEQTHRPVSLGLCECLQNFFDINEYVYDLGCSTGRYINFLKNKGFNIKGFDGTPDIKNISGLEEIEEFDLTFPLNLPKKGNILCLEVIEHINKEYEHIILDNIINNCSNKLVISWAIPGQGGKRHVNEQKSEYVLEIFKQKNFQLNKELTETFRNVSGKDLQWFSQSIYVFEKSNI
jgi:hypothetical protein